MSPSEGSPFSVVVTGEGRVSEDTTITVLDGHDEVRGTGAGTLALRLPSGLYSVQLERAGAREEHVHRHAGPTSLTLAEPARFSAVPATDTATSHEYYEAPAVAWSRDSTAPALPHAPGEPEGSLFVFVRGPEAGRSAAPLDGLGLRILNYYGHELVALDAATTRTDAGAGWLAFHAALGAGAYVLSQGADDDPLGPAREMAIEIFPGWQTQIFMTMTRTLSFASASVLMGHGFSPDDRVAQAVDAALLGLQNGADLLPAEERRLLLYAKFDNPMLGLVGAHVLLQGRDPDRRQVDAVLGNLGRLLGDDAADVRALGLIAARRWGGPRDARPFETPPVLRLGLEAVLAAAAQEFELVPRGGALEQIAGTRLVDSPWSTWRPVIGRPAAAPEWVSRYVADAALQAARQEAGDLDVAAAAAKASLPVASVAQAYDELRTNESAGPMRTIALEKLVTQTRREAPSLDLDPADVRRLFDDGGEGDRIRALALMQGDPATRDFGVALEGISDSRSRFEQYHALRLAQQMVPQLDAQQGSALSDAVTEQQRAGGDIQPGTDRWYVSNQLLSDLGET